MQNWSGTIGRFAHGPRRVPVVIQRTAQSVLSADLVIPQLFKIGVMRKGLDIYLRERRAVSGDNAATQKAAAAHKA